MSEKLNYIYRKQTNEIINNALNDLLKTIPDDCFSILVS